MSYNVNDLFVARNSRAAAAAGYEIERSVRFDSSSSAYLSRTPSSTGNRKTWTWAAWVKRSQFSTTQGRLFGGGVSGTDYFELYFPSGNELRVIWYTTGQTFTTTTPVYRDPSAWYHVVLSVDTTQATAADRIKIYVNGVFQPRTGSNPTQNLDTSVNNTVEHDIGRYLTGGGTSYFNGYLADIHFIDSQVLDPTSFGEFDDNGIWQPIEYSGTYGTNGFHLPFSDNSTAAALGDDTSGNNNDWTVNNISVTAGAGNDSLVDVPTNGSETDTGTGGEVRGNYATWLPTYGSTGTFTNGNLDVTTASSNSAAIPTSIFPSTGKWYWEVLIANYAGRSDSLRVGICNTLGVATALGANANTWCFLGDGRLYHNGSAPSYGVSVATGDIVNVALDLDAGKIWYGKNGTWMASGSPSTGANPSQSFTANQSMSPAVASGIDSPAYTLNAGQRPFAYTAPSGYKALCTSNLPTPTIADGSDYFDTILYTGNGSTQSISGLGFSPDFGWFKRRGVDAASHFLFDTVRGAGKYLISESSGAEGTDAVNTLQSFDSTGYTMGNTGAMNTLSSTYVVWSWDAGSSTVSNTDGSLTSSVRANTTAGFSIVSFTGNDTAGATVGHGLGVAPQFIVIKNRDGTNNWNIYHSSLGETKFLQFDTGATSSNTAKWNNTAPNSTVITLGTSSGTNNSSSMIAYCFAPVEGYSAFGSYTGNGSADGPFVYTGFRPKFIIGKRSDAANGWFMFDSARDGYNVADDYLAANASAAEATFTFADFLSNGFKLRSTTADWNGSDGTIIYAAFAENSFKTARAR